jgi:hypothetical protein
MSFFGKIGGKLNEFNPFNTRARKPYPMDERYHPDDENYSSNPNMVMPIGMQQNVKNAALSSSTPAPNPLAPDPISPFPAPKWQAPAGPLDAVKFGAPPITGSQADTALMSTDTPRNGYHFQAAAPLPQQVQFSAPPPMDSQGNVDFAKAGAGNIDFKSMYTPPPDTSELDDVLTKRNAALAATKNPQSAENPNGYRKHGLAYRLGMGALMGLSGGIMGAAAGAAGSAMNKDYWRNLEMDKAQGKVNKEYDPQLAAAREKYGIKVQGQEMGLKRAEYGLHQAQFAANQSNIAHDNALADANYKLAAQGQQGNQFERDLKYLGTLSPVNQAARQAWAKQMSATYGHPVDPNYLDPSSVAMMQDERGTFRTSKTGSYAEQIPGMGGRPNQFVTPGVVTKYAEDKTKANQKPFSRQAALKEAQIETAKEILGDQAVVVGPDGKERLSQAGAGYVHGRGKGDVQLKVAAKEADYKSGASQEVSAASAQAIENARGGAMAGGNGMPSHPSQSSKRVTPQQDAQNRKKARSYDRRGTSQQ